MRNEANRLWCSIAAYHIRKGEPLTGTLAEWLADALDKVAEGAGADRALGLVGQGRKRTDAFIERDMKIYEFISDYDTGRRGDLKKGLDLAEDEFHLSRERIQDIFLSMRKAVSVN